jgi:predicted nucleic acid-binding protein
VPRRSAQERVFGDLADSGLAALWRDGQVRAVGFPDLLIAAGAERERVTVLHYDSEFNLIARVTGQSVQWVVPRGTVP